MAKANMLKGFLSKIALPQEVRPDCWSTLKVERLMHDVGIEGYELLPQEKVVRLSDEAELVKIMLHLVPAEVSPEYHLILHKLEGGLRLQIGCWQFETVC